MQIQGFFSYAHKDEGSDPEITKFLLTELEARVNAELLNAEFSIWKDRRNLRIGDQWDDEIRQAISDSLIFIAVVTNKWIESDFCRREYQEFCRAHGDSGKIIPIYVREFESRAHHLNEEQLSTYEVLKKTQYRKLTAQDFYRLSSAQRVEFAETLAKDIEQAIERMRSRTPIVDTAPPEVPGLSADQVISLLRQFLTNGLSLSEAQSQLPKAAELLGTLSERLSRPTNDGPEISSILHAARAAIDVGELDKADGLLAEAEEADVAEGRRQLLRAAQTIASRADLAHSQARFEESASHYGRAAALVEQLDPELAWNWLSKQATALYDRATLTPSLEMLLAAVDILRTKVLSVAPRATRPIEWASTQNQLGNVLAELSVASGGEAGLKALNEAIVAYRAALEVRTREQFPADWAETQNGLGNALSTLGERGSGYAAIKALRDAAAALRASLEISSRESHPRQWARTQNNLGTVLALLGSRASGQSRLADLREAAEAFQSALEVRTRKESPIQWATTQGNLGNVLAVIGERDDSEEGLNSLRRAADTFRATFDVFTRSDRPADWARTQNNLADVLRSLGERVRGEVGVALLSEAVDAFRAALEVRTFRETPGEWAITQANLGNALGALGIQSNNDPGLSLLFEAASVHRDVLEHCSPRDEPALWAMTVGNFSLTSLAICSRTEKRHALHECAGFLEEAVAMFTTEGQSDIGDWLTQIVDEVREALESESEKSAGEGPA